MPQLGFQQLPSAEEGMGERAMNLTVEGPGDRYISIPGEGGLELSHGLAFLCLTYDTRSFVT